MTSILYNQVACSDYSNDFEVFHTSGSDVLKSQSLYNEKLSSDDGRFGPKNDYVGSHNAFIWKYFDKAADYSSDEKNGDDDIYGKTNDKYRQLPDVEQIEKVDHYDQAYDDYQYDRIRSLSHKQNQESQQNPKNCKIVVKGEMKCRVCKDSAGTHSKSCSVDSAPAKQKYEYTKQRLTAYHQPEEY